MAEMTCAIPADQLLALVQSLESTRTVDESVARYARHDAQRFVGFALHHARSSSKIPWSASVGTRPEDLTHSSPVWAYSPNLERPGTSACKDGSLFCQTGTPALHLNWDGAQVRLCDISRRPSVCGSPPPPIRRMLSRPRGRCRGTRPPALRRTSSPMSPRGTASGSCPRPAPS